MRDPEELAEPRRVGVLDRFRSWQFAIPILLVIVAGGLAVTTNYVDESAVLEGRLPLLSPTGSAARSLLSTVATATITVAAIVFSVTAVAYQVLATQYSPRVLQGFLNDRGQQLVLGLVAGTFTFSLVGQASVDDESGAASGSLTVTIALALGVASLLAIVGFIGRMMARLRVDDIISRLAEKSARSVESLFPAGPTQQVDHTWSLSPETTSTTVTSKDEGWFGGIDAANLLRLMPPGCVVRIEVATGEYVHSGDALVTVWMPAGEDVQSIAASIGEHAIRLLPDRTLEASPVFGFRQLVDIALRALSPGVNDPTTAADVVIRMVKPLRTGLERHPPPRVIHGEEGRVVYRPHEPDWADLIQRSFREIRLAADRQPSVAQALLQACCSLLGSADGSKTAVIETEIRLIVATVDSWSLDRRDREAVVSVLHRFGLEGQFLSASHLNDRGG